MADRMKALAAIGMLAEEAESRGDTRSVERLSVILEAFTEALSLASLTEQRRKVDRDRKRNSTDSTEAKSSTDFHGIPGNSSDVRSPVHYSKDLKDTTTPGARTVREILKVDDAKLLATVDVVQAEAAEHWPDIEDFLLRRKYAKWQGWLDEMRKAIGPGSQFTWADVGRVCSDDVLLKQPLGTAYALRRFLPLARIERVNAGSERPPPVAGAGPGSGTGARAFATTLAAIEDL